MQQWWHATQPRPAAGPQPRVRRRKSAMALLLRAVVALVAVLPHTRAEHPSFISWAAAHRPAGYTSAAERSQREATFLSNLKRIEAVNAQEQAKNGPLRLEINGWADLNFEEWKALNMGHGLGTDACAAQSGGKRHPDLQAVLDSGVPLADAVDWRDPAKNPAKINAVTPAKNQGGCGSCCESPCCPALDTHWHVRVYTTRALKLRARPGAFSTTGSMEGAHAIKTRKLVSLSEQQLIDCDLPDGGLKSKCCAVANPKGCDCGCKGGIMSRAFQYISHAGGLASEAAYNYTGLGGSCKAGIKPIATIAGQVNLSMGDLVGLAAAVATKGPVSVAIDVNFCWQFYQNGSVFYGNTTGVRTRKAMLARHCQCCHLLPQLPGFQW